MIPLIILGGERKVVYDDCNEAFEAYQKVLEGYYICRLLSVVAADIILLQNFNLPADNSLD